MIRVTDDTTEIRGSMPQILDDIMSLFKALNKNCSRVEKLMIFYLLRDVVELLDIEKEK